MTKYIALLRGINVGGKNKVSMPELKEVFEQNGFNEVLTYINSGNVIFSSETSDEIALKEICETSIFEKFQFNIKVGIISADDLKEALGNAPAWWGQDGASKHNAILVIPPMTAEKVFQEVGDIKPEYEKVDYYGHVIFWSAPIKTFSRTRWSKVVGSSIYHHITIRNANTMKKLLALVDSYMVK